MAMENHGNRFQCSLGSDFVRIIVSGKHPLIFFWGGRDSQILTDIHNYTYTYIHTSTFKHNIRMCIYIIYVYIYIYICIYMYTYIYIYIHTYVYIYMLCLNIDVCIYVYIYIYIHFFDRYAYCFLHVLICFSAKLEDSSTRVSGIINQQQLSLW